MITMYDYVTIRDISELLTHFPKVVDAEDKWFLTTLIPSSSTEESFYRIEMGKTYIQYGVITRATTEELNELVIVAKDMHEARIVVRNGLNKMVHYLGSSDIKIKTGNTVSLLGGRISFPLSDLILEESYIDGEIKEVIEKARVRREKREAKSKIAFAKISGTEYTMKFDMIIDEYMTTKKLPAYRKRRIKGGGILENAQAISAFIAEKPVSFTSTWGDLILITKSFLVNGTEASKCGFGGEMICVARKGDSGQTLFMMRSFKEIEDEFMKAGIDLLKDDEYCQWRLYGEVHP